MKTIIPAIILAQLYLLFLGCILISPAYLPERLATGFNLAGEPECWMDRSSYMMFVSGMGSFGVIFFVIMGFVSRFMPKWISLPQRDYWLAPERRVATMNYVFCQMLWFDCLLTCFIIAIHFSTIHANRITPVHLPQGEFFSILGCFLAGTLIWVLVFMLHFRRKD